MSVNFLMPAFVGHQVVTNGVAGSTVKWTDEGRDGVQENRDERSVVVTTAGGTNIKYTKGRVKRKWLVQWTMMPQNQFQSIDGGWARDELRNFCFNTNSGAFNLVIDNTGNISTVQSINDSQGGQLIEVHFVYIDNYQETLELRRVSGNRYNLEIDLTEV